MKKVVAYVLVSLVCFVLVACGSKNLDDIGYSRKESRQTSTSSTESDNQSEETVPPSSSSAPATFSEETPTSTSEDEGIFPPKLLGTWRGYSDNIGYVTMVFSENGIVETFMEANRFQSTAQVQGLEEVIPNTYRYLLQDTSQIYALIPGYQLGGKGIKYEYGLLLEGDQLKVLVWSVPVEEEFDYASPIPQMSPLLIKQ
ncbi:hypothetical protein ACVR1I_07300 [Streptococcus cameli]